MACSARDALRERAGLFDFNFARRVPGQIRKLAEPSVDVLALHFAARGPDSGSHCPAELGNRAARAHGVEARGLRAAEIIGERGTLGAMYPLHETAAFRV